MPCGILHPMVWGTSMNSLALILKTINLFPPCKLIFWKATEVGSTPNFPKLISQLWGISWPQYFVTSLLEPHLTYFWKHYIYHKELCIIIKYCGCGIPHNWDMSFGKCGRLPTLVAFLDHLQGRNKLIVLSMSTNEFTEVPHTIGCKIPQSIAC